MLEYFTYKKFKKHQAAKEAGAEEVLTPKDEKYFEGLVENPDAQAVVLSGDRTPGTSSPSSSGALTPATASESSTGPKKHTWKESVSGYATGTYDKASGYASDTIDRARSVKLPSVFAKKDGEKRADSKDRKGKGKSKEEEEYYATLTAEERELHEALDGLNLAAQDGTAFSLSKETKDLLQKFTQILKDMANGVPTAYDDLINLFETKSKQIEKLFDATPGFVKKLAKQIPMGLGGKEGVASEGAGIAAQAATLGLPTLQQLVTKPGMVANALKTVVNAIKLRFPGIVLGTNVILSMAIFVLLFVFWYCYKRGKEVRLEKERLEQEELDSKIAEDVLRDAPSVPVGDPVASSTITNEPPTSIQNPTAGIASSSSSGVGYSNNPGSHQAQQHRDIKDLF